MIKMRFWKAGHKVRRKILRGEWVPFLRDLWHKVEYCFPFMEE